jgi:hypothetical protein
MHFRQTKYSYFSTKRNRIIHRIIIEGFSAMDAKYQDSTDTDAHTWGAIHDDLLTIKEQVYDPCQFACSLPLMEAESADYGAYVFQLNDYYIRFRVAKITPTKIGQFVTLWKRTGNSPIQPYDIADPFDLFVISTRKDNQFGQFVFPKSVLHAQGVLSKHGKGGKRAIRVYPPWDKTISKQAQKTQAWQLKYFLEIPHEQVLDCERVRRLYCSLS